MKRIFDLILALFGLLVLSPIFLLISFLIKLHDKGPVLFKQIRIGKYGKPFFLYKFRSMGTNQSDYEGTFDPGNSEDITPIGRFLRKTKCDELPQLVNVLKGEMSMVGPRPEVEKWVSLYPERWKRILTLSPGITDNASIMFRIEESLLSGSEDPEKMYREIILPKKLDLYEEYLSEHSLLGDLKLIWKTVVYIIYKK